MASAGRRKARRQVKQKRLLRWIAGGSRMQKRKAIRPSKMSGGGTNDLAHSAICRCALCGFDHRARLAARDAERWDAAIEAGLVSSGLGVYTNTGTSCGNRASNRLGGAHRIATRKATSH